MRDYYSNDVETAAEFAREDAEPDYDGPTPEDLAEPQKRPERRIPTRWLPETIARRHAEGDHSACHPDTCEETPF